MAELPPSQAPELRRALANLDTEDPDGEFAAALRASGKVLLPLAFEFTGDAKPAPESLADSDYLRLDRSMVPPIFPLQPKAALMLTWQETPRDPWASDRGDRIDQARLDGLPSARNIWSVLQTQEPSTVTNHVDEGGIDTGIVALAGVYGGSWTQNGYRWDGLNVTDPYDPG